MKKIYLLAFVAITSIAVISCQKDENPDDNNGGDVYSSITVPQTNTALVVKHSGTACPPCGGWGWTAWDEIRTTNTANARFVTAYDDNFVAKLFINQVSEDWANGLAINSWPTFCANYKIQTAKTQSGGIDVNQTKTNIQTTVNTHSAGPVVANAAFKATAEGDLMKVNIKTKFFNAADGDYYMAVYVVEDGVMGTQSGHPSYPTAVAHEFVLRDTYSPSGSLNPSYGTLLSSGAVAAGTEFKTEYTYRIEPTWNKDKIHTYVVLWKKNGTKYEFVNVSK